MKRPSFQFYPGDWQRDNGVKICSISARGLWIEMLCLMHEGRPYGHLTAGDKVILPVNLAKLVGLSLDETQRLLDELSEADVYSKTPEGCIYSRRMVKDEALRAKRAAGGILGGNPALLKVGEDNLQDNLNGNVRLTPAVASASSPPKIKKKKAESTHEEWLTMLQSSDAYRMIDVRREFSKMQIWCETHRTTASRSRFINWLNKARVDAPIQAKPNENGFDYWWGHSGEGKKYAVRSEALAAYQSMKKESEDEPF